MSRDRLGDILIRAGLLDEEGLARALNEQQRWGGPIGRYLVDLGLISEETLIRALSTQYKLPAVALDAPKLSLAIARLIPRELCERHRLICFRADRARRFLDIAMADPSNHDAVDEVRVTTGFNVRPHIAGPNAIDRAITHVFYGDVSMGGELDFSPGSPMRAHTPRERTTVQPSQAQAQPPQAQPPQAQPPQAQPPQAQPPQAQAPAAQPASAARGGAAAAAPEASSSARGGAVGEGGAASTSAGAAESEDDKPQNRSRTITATVMPVTDDLDATKPGAGGDADDEDLAGLDDVATGDAVPVLDVRVTDKSKGSPNKRPTSATVRAIPAVGKTADAPEAAPADKDADTGEDKDKGGDYESAPEVALLDFSKLGAAPALEPAKIAAAKAKAKGGAKSDASAPAPALAPAGDDELDAPRATATSLRPISREKAEAQKKQAEAAKKAAVEALKRAEAARKQAAAEAEADAAAASPGSQGKLDDSKEFVSPKATDSFHITMDVPEGDKAELAQLELERRVETLEAKVRRDRALIDLLLQRLVAHGALTPAESEALLEERSKKA